MVNVPGQGVLVPRGRALAYQSATTTHPAHWHDDLQAFYHRMGLALGTGAGDCRAGRHEARPAAVDIATYEHLTDRTAR